MTVAPGDSFAASQSHRDSLLRHVAERPVRIEEADSRWLDLARYFSTSWPLTVHVEPSQFSIGLPEDARRAGIVPGVGGTVAVFAAGDVLEIWSADDWIRHVQKIGRQLPNIGPDLLESLEARETIDED